MLYLFFDFSKLKSQFQIQSKHEEATSWSEVSQMHECEYASSQADVVRSHVIAQSGEKSQKCNKCDYLVSHANTLKVHTKIHFKCNICLSRLHGEIHSEEKLFWGKIS